jgi:hypothetical protein
MRPHSRVPIYKHRVPLVLVSAFALGGLLASTTGCPAKATCPPCYVGDVMADGSTPSATPKSAVYLQLDSSYRSEKVSEVKLILMDAAGTAETLTWSGEKVKGINATSLTSIADSELYDVNGQPPVSAEVEFVFGSGKSTPPATITIKPEAKTATTTAPTAPKPPQ